MGGNQYLARQAAERRELVLATERITKQLCIDVMQITLNEEFGFGYDRLSKLTDEFVERYGKYVQAMLGGDEHDVWQERLDAALIRIVKNNGSFSSFAERYPEIRRHGYDKRPPKRK